MNQPEKKQEYQERLGVVYNGVNEREVGEVEEEWKVTKESLVGNATEVCGKRSLEVV